MATSRPRRLCSRLSMAVLFSLSVACGFIPGVGTEGPNLYDPSYRQDMERFTRHQSLYQGLQRRLIWAATLESLRFRILRSEAYASILRLTEAELASLLVQEEREAEDYVDFFVGFFTERLAWNDLDGDRSIWRADLLIDGSKVLLPVRIERILNPNANVRALYPYLGHFSRAYRLRFLRKDAEGRPMIPDGASVMTLRVSSSIAHGELTWPTSLLDESPVSMLPGRPSEN